MAGRPAIAYLFSPVEAEVARRDRLHAARKTPLSYGNRPGTNRSASPQRTVGNCYDVAAYRRAIARGCDLAFPPLSPLSRRPAETVAEWLGRLTQDERAQLHAWQRDHRWHPHQLRHNAATRIRRERGLDAARALLGHRSLAVTEVYAELDAGLAADTARKFG